MILEWLDVTLLAEMDEWMHYAAPLKISSRRAFLLASPLELSCQMNFADFSQNSEKAPKTLCTMLNTVSSPHDIGNFEFCQTSVMDLLCLNQGVGVLWRRLPENIIFQPQRIICGITFTSFLSGFPIFWSFDLFVMWIEFCLLYFYNPFFRNLCCLQNKRYLVWCR